MMTTHWTIAPILHQQYQDEERAKSAPSSDILTKNESARKYNVAIGIISAERPPSAPEYAYPEVMSILDTLFVNSKYLNIDKIHIFDSAVNGSQVKYFKYTNHIEVHRMDPAYLYLIKDKPVNAGASLNYMLGLKYIMKQYRGRIDAVLMLEDDVIFDPHAEYIIYTILDHLRNFRLFLVDGYIHKGIKPNGDEESLLEHPVIEYKQDAACCSQSYLLSPLAAELAIPLIERSLNGTEEYRPLDIQLSSSLMKIPGFTFFLSKICWVQHIGYPYLGLGYFHRGCSNMELDN